MWELDGVADNPVDAKQGSRELCPPRGKGRGSCSIVLDTVWPRLRAFWKPGKKCLCSIQNMQLFLPRNPTSRHSAKENYLMGGGIFFFSIDVFLVASLRMGGNLENYLPKNRDS